MNIFYEKPNDSNWDIVSKIDLYGKTFWINWFDWLNATKIEKPEDINLLPDAVSQFIPKWAENMSVLAKEKYLLPYPIKLVTIHFILNNEIYVLTPGLFKNEKCLQQYQFFNYRYYFEGIKETIYDDLKSIGCKYAEYSDFMD